jgi:hypothetical protein
MLKQILTSKWHPFSHTTLKLVKNKLTIERVYRFNLTPRMMVRVFMPVDYPHSTGPAYTRYAAWSFLHYTAGSVTGVLSMQSLLYAVGLGHGAIPARTYA